MSAKNKNRTAAGGWVVLHCDMDDSHALIPESDVICAHDRAAVDEKVMFSYPGFKKLLKGTVKALSDDYDELKAFQDKLNVQTKPPREPSFHEDQPRRAARRQTSQKVQVQSGLGIHKHVSTPSHSKESSSRMPKPLKEITTSARSKPTPPVATKKRKVSPYDSDMPSEKNVTPLGALLSQSSSSSGSDDSDTSSTEGKDTTIAVQHTHHDTRKEQEVAKNRAAKMTFKEIREGGIDFQTPKKDTGKRDRADAENNGKVTTARPVRKDASAIVPDDAGSGKPVVKEASTSNNSREHNHLLANDKSDSSESGSDLDDAQKEFLEMISKKKKFKDLGELLNLSKQKKRQTVDQTVNHAPTVQEEIEGNGEGCSKDTPEESDQLKADYIRGPFEGLNDDLNLEEPHQEKPKAVKRMYPPKKRSKPLMKEVHEIVFNGNFFRYSSGDSTKEVEKLSAKHDVWIASSDLKDIRRRWHTGTAVARSLARKVFSEEALLVCSVSGKVKVSKDGKAERRTPLDPNGVEAILDFVKSRCDKKKWPKPDDSALKQAINNMLFEERECKVVVDSD